ncbi:MAG: DNA-binding protein [Planctomycetes bacterium]|nr:DNA-binding protein [Planctomycetota bacterium]
MRVLRAGEKLFMVRVDRGEEVVAALQAVALSLGIKSGAVTGIGGLREARLAFLDTKTRQYQTRDFAGDYELISLTGNFALFEGRPFLHAHVVLSDAEFRCVAGHLVSAVVGVTGEFALRAGDAPLERRQNDDLGIKEQYIPRSFLPPEEG